MEHYKILGINENASMEQVERAYEAKVRQFKAEIQSEKMLKKFLKVFDEAYEAIREEKEKNQNYDSTVFMSSSQIKSIESSRNSLYSNDIYKENKNYGTIKEKEFQNDDDATVFMSSSQIKAMESSRNNFYRDDIYEEDDEYFENNSLFFEDWNDDDFEDYEEEAVETKTSKASNKSRKGQKNKRNNSKKKKSKGKEKFSIIDLLQKPIDILEKYIKEK